MTDSLVALVDLGISVVVWLVVVGLFWPLVAAWMAATSLGDRVKRLPGARSILGPAITSAGLIALGVYVAKNWPRTRRAFDWVFRAAIIVGFVVAWKVRPIEPWKLAVIGCVGLAAGFVHLVRWTGGRWILDPGVWAECRARDRRLEVVRAGLGLFVTRWAGCRSR